MDILTLAATDKWGKLAGSIGLQATMSVINILKNTTKGTPIAVDELLGWQYDKMTDQDVLDGVKAVFNHWRKRNNEPPVNDDWLEEEFFQWQREVDLNNYPPLGSQPSKFSVYVTELLEAKKQADLAAIREALTPPAPPAPPTTTPTTPTPAPIRVTRQQPNTCMTEAYFEDIYEASLILLSMSQPKSKKSKYY